LFVLFSFAAAFVSPLEAALVSGGKWPLIENPREDGVE